MNFKNDTEKAKLLLHAFGLRSTLSRIKVLDFVTTFSASHSAPFSVEDVYQHLLSQNNAISKSCITNTLNTLVVVKVLKKHRMISSAFFYSYIGGRQ